MPKMFYKHCCVLEAIHEFLSTFLSTVVIIVYDK